MLKKGLLNVISLDPLKNAHDVHVKVRRSEHINTAHICCYCIAIVCIRMTMSILVFDHQPDCHALLDELDI